MVVSLQLNSSAKPAAEYSAAAEASLKWKRDVYLTGFGKFSDILENPTSILAKKLETHPKVIEAHVLEVSKDGCVEILTKMQTRAEERRRPCVFLHFGVDTTSCSLVLERMGYNVANFRIPDERGYVAKNEIICEDGPDIIETTIPVEDMLKTLQTVYPRIEISTDPGRYICNFVYYCSLDWAKQQRLKGFSDYRALFVHVPEFRIINLEVQLEVASKIVDYVASL
ncbi:putative peptidase C15, pyroglutamyl peptidase I [Plasmopara halstedii]